MSLGEVDDGGRPTKSCSNSSSDKVVRGTSGPIHRLFKMCVHIDSTRHDVTSVGFDYPVGRGAVRNADCFDLVAADEHVSVTHVRSGDDLAAPDQEGRFTQCVISFI